MSVLGLVLVLLYAADVLAIARRHGVDAHSYADDSQLYRHAPADLRVAWHATISVVSASSDASAYYAS